MSSESRITDGTKKWLWRKCRVLHWGPDYRYSVQGVIVPDAAVAKRPFPLRPTAPIKRTTIPYQNFSAEVARRLVEQTESHVVVGLLLLLLLGGGGSLGLGGTTSGGSSTTSGGGGTTGGNGGELGLTLGDQLRDVSDMF